MIKNIYSHITKLFYTASDLYKLIGRNCNTIHCVKAFNSVIIQISLHQSLPCHTNKTTVIDHCCTVSYMRKATSVHVSHSHTKQKVNNVLTQFSFSESLHEDTSSTLALDKSTENKKHQTMDPSKHTHDENMHYDPESNELVTSHYRCSFSFGIRTCSFIQITVF